MTCVVRVEGRLWGPVLPLAILRSVLEKRKDYVVNFPFPEPPELREAFIVKMDNVSFHYPNCPTLFEVCNAKLCAMPASLDTNLHVLRMKSCAQDRAPHEQKTHKAPRTIFMSPIKAFCTASVYCLHVLPPRTASTYQGGHKAPCTAFMAPIKPSFPLHTKQAPQEGPSVGRQPPLALRTPAPCSLACHVQEVRKERGFVGAYLVLCARAIQWFLCCWCTWAHLLRMLSTRHRSSPFCNTPLLNKPSGHYSCSNRGT